MNDMNEIEAIEIIGKVPVSLNYEGSLVEIKKAYDVIQKAIEEIQQYRAIGTVEDLKTMKENGAFTGVELAQILAMQMELKKYQSIGTIEEFKALKEKNEPKKPNGIERKRDEHGFIYQIGKCPCCGKLVTDDRECCDCMQKFDWRE